MTANLPVPFECDDGSLFVPRRLVTSLTEIREEGGLTVALAYRLLSRWRVEAGNGGLLDGRKR